MKILKKELVKGLENVIALESKIAFIDGEKGVLEYRGCNIRDLSRLSYEAVAFLLLHGKFPNKKELEDFSSMLKAERDIDDSVIKILNACSKEIDAADVLRTAVSYLAQSDKDLNDNSFEANMRKSIRLVAKFPTLIAAYYRIKTGQKPIFSKPNLSHSANFLYMLTGNIPEGMHAKGAEIDFVLTAEHGLNASTFAVRVAASTLSDIHSAIIAGLATLRGPLHGGARREVMLMLDSIEKPEKAEQYVLNLIEKKQKIMGFGHRVYKTHDPRSKIFKELIEKLDKEKKEKWYEIAKNVEKTVLREVVEKKGKPIYPNVDFYSGVLYKYLKIPPEIATSMFAIGRISGWIAHYLEQSSDNRLIRPRAKYIGPHNLKISQ